MGAESVSDIGLDLIRHYEGYSATLYRCAAGYLTIGYGHLVREAEREIFLGGIDEEEAERLLAQDVREAERAVCRLISVQLTQPQRDALISFCYNLGGAALQRSTLRRCVNRREHDRVPQQFLRWIWAGGRRLPGLIRRRSAEAQLYASAGCVVCAPARAGAVG